MERREWGDGKAMAREDEEDTWEKMIMLNVEVERAGAANSKGKSRVQLAHTETNLHRLRMRATTQNIGCAESVCLFLRLALLQALQSLNLGPNYV